MVEKDSFAWKHANRTLQGVKIDLGELGSFSLLATPSHNAQKAFHHHRSISAGAVIFLNIIMKGSLSTEEVI